MDKFNVFLSTFFGDCLILKLSNETGMSYLGLLRKLKNLNIMAYA